MKNELKNTSNDDWWILLWKASLDGFQRDSRERWNEWKNEWKNEKWMEKYIKRWSMNPSLEGITRRVPMGLMWEAKSPLENVKMNEKMKNEWKNTSNECQWILLWKVSLDGSQRDSTERQNLLWRMLKWMKKWMKKWKMNGKIHQTMIDESFFERNH